MIPAIVVALLVSRTGAHAKGMRARVACDTVASSDRGSGVVNVVAPGLDGRVAWTDTKSRQLAGTVWLRDRTGAIRSIGRAGGGPGEFRDASAITWFGDTLAITDPSQHRLQRFLASGHFIDSRVTSGRTNFLLQPGGTLVGGEFVVPRPTEKGSMDVVGTLPIAVIRQVPGTEQTDTLLKVTPSPFADPRGLDILQQPARVTHSADGKFWCIMAAAASPGMQLSCVDASGNVSLHGVRNVTPLPVTEAQWKFAVDMAAAVFAVPRADIIQMFHRPVPPASAYAIFVNRNGDVWLQRSIPTSPAVRWDRMRRDGSPLPSVMIPVRHQMRALDGNFYYAADTDDDGLQTLIRCPIP